VRPDRTTLLVGLVIAVAAAVTVAIRRRIATVTVSGPSMLPTLADGDRLLIRRVRLADLAVGDIVVLQRPTPDDTWRTEPPRWPPTRGDWLIKRVAALPGDPVPAGIPAPDATVPGGHLVVLGDNRAASYDSRTVGHVPADRILGVVVRAVAGRPSESHRILTARSGAYRLDDRYI
jgi:signal peptidase I